MQNEYISRTSWIIRNILVPNESRVRGNFVDIYITTFSAAGELSRDQNSKPLQLWPKTVLTRKWIER